MFIFAFFPPFTTEISSDFRVLDQTNAEGRSTEVATAEGAPDDEAEGTADGEVEEPRDGEDEEGEDEGGEDVGGEDERGEDEGAAEGRGRSKILALLGKKLLKSSFKA